ncbi:MAG: hypothetical protein ACRDTD_06895 [Pseudonocardiaceae bacterium]
MSVRWALSILDFHSHAVDELRDHPHGVVQTECGHRLMVTTPLSEEPLARPCGRCAVTQAARAVTRWHDEQLPASWSVPISSESENLAMTSCWYLQPMGDSDKHWGSLVRGTVQTDCGLAFRASRAVPLRLPAAPPYPEGACAQCLRVKAGGPRETAGLDPAANPSARGPLLSLFSKVRAVFQRE